MPLIGGMYLKALDLVGFKSFADPTKISFHKGVTAIVGPNGCGKSNVLDSIRWVLGEQSAKALRGGNMQDVIFSGTDSRRPLGMAEVSMTFAECEEQLGTEYHEVTITRRVFRDGRSEYEINKTPCRLKDIHMLFMDTGIGRSAYSIMEQGKIDKILSAKPDDRREVFEEAAGITRFKSQKKEALRKLEATESNLIRVSDIIKEVGRQIGSLQRQAAKARRYQDVFQRLRYFDTRAAHHQFHHLREKFDSGSARVKQLQMEFETIQQELDQREQDLSAQRARLDSLEGECRRLDQVRAAAESAGREASQTIEFNQQRISELAAQKEKNLAEIRTSDEKSEILRGQLTAAEGEEAAVGTELEQVNTELAERTTALESARTAVKEARKRHEETSRALADLEKQTTQKQARLDSLEIQHKSGGVRREKLGEESLRLEASGKELEEKLSALRRQQSERQEELSAWKEKLETVRRETAALSEERDQARAKADQTRLEADKAASQSKLLHDLIASRSGYSDSTRKLLEAHTGAGVEGTLIEHLDIEPGYERAIQRALGAVWEAILIESPDAAEHLAGALGDAGSAVLADLSPVNGISRGVFQRLADTILGRTAGAKASILAPEHAAARFVTTRGRAAELVDRLLDSYLVADDAAAAADLRRRFPLCNIVSRQGEVWLSNGIQIRGTGTNHGADMVIQHERDLKQLENRLPGLQATAAAAATASTAAQHALLEAEERLDKARQECQEREGALTALSYELQGLERQQQDWRKQMDSIQRERVQLNEQDAAGIKEQEDLRAALDRLHQARPAADGAVANAAGALQATEAAADTAAHAVTDTRVRHAAIEQKSKSAGQQAGTLRRQYEETQTTATLRRREIEEYDRKSAECGEAITRCEASIAESRQQAQAAADSLAQFTSERTAAQGKLTDLEQHAREGRKRAGEVQSQCGREEVQVAEQRLHLDNLADRIRRAYQIELASWAPRAEGEPVVQPPSPAEAWLRPQDEPIEGAIETTLEEAPEVEADFSDDPLLAEPVDWTAVEAEVAQMRDRIDRMGPVNVEAITEYEELEQRHTFLKNQEHDLLRARDQLHEAIKKINQTTQVMFAETFAKIRANFAEMFVELFGGGKAELRLQDENDPLECGIEIEAKPPGKQLQSITLLSGGERTMTAVALLFSIYMVKPSPFCFLDEMDAPLDESNINRFIRILQRFVTQSQFVCITHNKRTISSADVLYGVTMEQHGISKIVSVKLARDDEDPLFNGHGKRKDEEDFTPTIADSIRSGPVISS